MIAYASRSFSSNSQDLVDQPQNILSRLRDGTYTVNYQSLWNRIDDQQSTSDVMLTLSSEVDDLLSPSFSPTPSFESFTSSLNDMVGVTNGKSGVSKELDAELAFYRAIVEHGKDFVHILSLRGRFLYVSRRATKSLLEHTEEELVGRSLSEFCHPADLLVVMRDLRNAMPGESIQLLYRFKRKQSGYIWIEARGELTRRLRTTVCLNVKINARPALNNPQATSTKASQSAQNVLCSQDGKNWSDLAAPWTFPTTFGSRGSISGPSSV